MLRVAKNVVTSDTTPHHMWLMRPLLRPVVKGGPAIVVPGYLPDIRMPSYPLDAQTGTKDPGLQIGDEGHYGRSNQDALRWG